MVNKRGQLYIFAALILCIVLFVLIGRRVLVEQESVDDDFEELSKNYNYEAARFINTLLAGSRGSIESEFVKFTTKFTSYSKNQNPDFMFVYTFKYKGGDGVYKLFLGNYLDIPIWVASGENINLDTANFNQVPGCFDEVPACVSVQGFTQCVGTIDMQSFGCTKSDLSADYPIHAIISGIHYTLSVKSESPEIVIISREILKEQRKVYINEDFVTGEKIAEKSGELTQIKEGDSSISKSNACRSLHSTKEECNADSGCKWNGKECGE